MTTKTETVKRYRLMVKSVYRKRFEVFTEHGTLDRLKRMGMQLSEGTYAERYVPFWKGCEFRVEERTITVTTETTPWRKA